MTKSEITSTTIKKPGYTPAGPKQKFDSGPAEELVSLISEVFGNQHGSIKRAAQVLEVNYDNLRKMIACRRNVPARILNELEELAAMKRIPAPPEGGDPAAEDMAVKAISPYASHLVSRFCAAGWQRDVVALTLINWAGQAVVDTLGKQAAHDLFQKAAKAVLED